MAEQSMPKVESNIFLSYPTSKGDVSVHFKISTEDASALEDIETIIKEKVEEGVYKPGNGNGKGASSGSAPAPRGGGYSGSRRGGGGARSGGDSKPDRF